MSVPYDKFTEAFLSKVTEFEFVNMRDFERNGLIDGYMKRAISAFKNVCQYDLSSTADDVIREFNVDIPAEDIDEIVEIVSEGMLVQWMKPYTYKQENLELVLNTRDFTTYSLLISSSNKFLISSPILYFSFRLLGSIKGSVICAE